MSSIPKCGSTIMAMFFTGSGSTTADGTVTLDFGEGPEVFYLNASKNLMARVIRETEEQRFTVIVKAPASVSASELAGPWRFASMQTPNRLVESYLGSATGMSRQSMDSSDFAGRTGLPEELADTFFMSEFEVDRGVVGIGTDGNLTARFSGSVAAGAAGSVTVTVGGETLPFFINETKDVMVHVTSTGDAQEIIALVRVPLEPMKIAVDATGGKLNLLWMGQGNVRLQRSTTLNGWANIMGNGAGQSAFESSTTTAEFYRLVEIGSDLGCVAPDAGCSGGFGSARLAFQVLCSSA
jgi:hypothetical protein